MIEARMQPEVVQPVTITVSTWYFVKKVTRGVIKNIEGALLLKLKSYCGS